MTRRAKTVCAISGVVALLLAACGGGERATPTSAPKPPSPTAAPAATPTSAPAASPTPRPAASPTRVPATPTPAGPQPKSGGGLRGSLLTEPANWDSYDARGQLPATVAFMPVFNNIIVFDAEKPSLITPDLAERWEQSGDGKTVTFSIRKGVKWHNGRDLTAQDIAWNIERGARAEGTTNFNKSRFVAVENVETPDNFTVKVNLKRPNGSFLPNMATVFVLVYPPFGPTPNSSEFQTPANAVGTGPFKLQSYTRGGKVEYVRNDSYFKKDESGRPLPYLNTVTYFYLSGAAGLAAWRSKQIDCGCVWDHTYLTKQEDILRRDFPDAKLVGRNTALFHFQFNQKAPWTDVRLRRAVFAALDRLQMRDLYRGGKAHYPPHFMLNQELGGGWALPTEELLRQPGFRLKDNKKDPADLDLSRQLFREVGVDPKTLKIVFNYAAVNRDLGELYQAALAQTGVPTELRLLDTAPLTDVLQRGDFDIAAVIGGNGFDDPSDQPTRYILSNSPENYGKWKRPQIDDLYSRIDSELDPAKRRELAYQWQRLMLEEAVASPVLHNYAINGPHRHVFGLARGHYSTHSGQRLEGVWIDESRR